MRYYQPTPIGKLKRQTKKGKKIKFNFHFFTQITMVIFVLTCVIVIQSYLIRKEVLILKTNKPKYLRYEFVQFKLDFYSRYAEPETNFIVTVEKNGHPITTIGDVKACVLRHNYELHYWEGKWPIPWNAPGGVYTAKVIIPRKGKPFITKKCQFEIQTPAPANIKPGLCVLTLESTLNLKAVKIKGPDGTLGDMNKIIDWADFIGANCIWYLTGQTASWGQDINDKLPWIATNINLAPDLAKLAHSRGLTFGAWVACFLTFGNPRYKGAYNYAWNYDANLQTCIPTRSISIGDIKRKKDIINLLKNLSKVPQIDYLGLDYIRNAIGGYEMVDEFVKDMNPELPRHWSRFNKMERMCWLGREIQKRQKMRLVDQWNWWRAHYVAGIIKEIKQAIGNKKPLWAFTLSWEKGWQHGQDPIMFNDAGIEVNAVMLYECDRWQFDDLIKDWNKYITKNQVNLVAGDVVDWNLHQRTTNPAGPEEMFNRILTAHKKLSADGKIKGIFWHDLARALWGRLGPYSTQEWAIAGGAAFSQFRKDWGLVDLETQLQSPDSSSLTQNIKLNVVLTNHSEQYQRNILLKLLPTPGISFVGEEEQLIKTLEPKKSVEIPFIVKINQVLPERNNRYMLATSCQWEVPEKDKVNKFISFKYINLQE